ncbi:hypothetical protein J2Z21_000573 [Streptomyces griseochromogenes]|uniref:Uncharacterized protein n=1 Tax=Streptomyces griseochromogenes TaxID=68214 RepID=A0ABS4LJU7_9ACTN|nr:hypothetical protein [Streptomyces griseochromogenes]MBP2047651.1 hypothetical protein [Streptomyces griseochromogenes]
MAEAASFVVLPGTFPGATTPEQACTADKFTPVHDAWYVGRRATAVDRQ